jgi:hypothetical protein
VIPNRWAKTSRVTPASSNHLDSLVSFFLGLPGLVSMSPGGIITRLEELSTGGAVRQGSAAGLSGDEGFLG